MRQVHTVSFTKFDANARLVQLWEAHKKLKMAKADSPQAHRLWRQVVTLERCLVKVLPVEEPILLPTLLADNIAAWLNRSAPFLGDYITFLPPYELL